MTNFDDRYWSEPNEAHERYMKLKMVDTSYVGTDPMQASGMQSRRIKTGPMGLGEVGFGLALETVVERTVNRWFDDQKPPVPPDVRARMNGNRDPGIRAEMKYKARPLDGIWASPPFLHNGSVPNLYLLLGTVDARPKKFFLGNREFDPKYVGYDYSTLDGGFELDTSVPGNSNAGHEFRDGPKGNGVVGRALSEDERWALVEYLKALAPPGGELGEHGQSGK
jgi:hypothetical protein